MREVLGVEDVQALVSEVTSSAANGLVGATAGFGRAAATCLGRRTCLAATTVS
jgi:hypothetical protein